MEAIKPQRKVAAPQPIDSATNPNALLKRPTVSALVGFNRSALYARVKAGEFPKPIKLGPRCVRWRAGEVAAWLESVGNAAS